MDLQETMIGLVEDLEEEGEAQELVLSVMKKVILLESAPMVMQGVVTREGIEGIIIPLEIGKTRLLQRGRVARKANLVPIHQHENPRKRVFLAQDLLQRGRIVENHPHTREVIPQRDTKRREA